MDYILSLRFVKLESWPSQSIIADSVESDTLHL